MTGRERVPHAIMVPHEGGAQQEGETPEGETGRGQAGTPAQEIAMTREYVHQPLNNETSGPAGSYTLLKELRLDSGRRQVLCVTGVGMLECSCCEGLYITAGSGGPYALVPGYIVSWHCGESDSGLPVSEVEPVLDRSTRREIGADIERAEGIRNIEFWE